MRSVLPHAPPGFPQFRRLQRSRSPLATRPDSANSMFSPNKSISSPLTFRNLGQLESSFHPSPNQFRAISTSSSSTVSSRKASASSKHPRVRSSIGFTSSKRLYGQSSEPLVVKAEKQIEELMKLQKGHKREFSESIVYTTGQVTKQQNSISDMLAIGFDYDYTLANYTPAIQKLIYDMAKSYMVNSLMYPEEFTTWANYDPGFAIRGLYYDTDRGTLLKLDYLNYLQPDAVYFGKRQLSTEEVIQAYGTYHLSYRYYERMRPMIDNFSLPEACLIADAIEFFVRNGINFDPRSIHSDVFAAIKHIHTTQALHREVMRSLDVYLPGERPKLAAYLQKLNRKEHKLFLLTNSPFWFVNAGMSKMLGPSWRDLFQCIIVSADKPEWYTAKGKPFRRMDAKSGQIFWDQVGGFERAQVYVGGSMDVFNRLTQYPSWRVLYLGDHLFSDLREPSRTEGWRTGAIVSELDKEIAIQHTQQYEDSLVELMKLLRLHNNLDMLAKDKEATVLAELQERIGLLRRNLKVQFNPYFGSVFRTHTNMTVFSFLCQRYADLYTSNIENLSGYPHDFVYSAQRTFLPHEFDVMKRIWKHNLDQ